MSTRPPIQPAAERGDIERAIATWFAANEASFRAVQARYFAAKRVHFQGLVTPTTPPDDGAEADADYSRRPQDKAETWADVFRGVEALPAKLPCALRLDVYGSTEGDGYTLTALYTKDGRRYERVLLHEGPEREREHDWQDRTPPAEVGRV